MNNLSDLAVTIVTIGLWSDQRSVAAASTDFAWMFINTHIHINIYNIFNIHRRRLLISDTYRKSEATGRKSVPTQVPQLFRNIKSTHIPKQFAKRVTLHRKTYKTHKLLHKKKLRFIVLCVHSATACCSGARNIYCNGLVFYITDRPLPHTIVQVGAASTHNLIIHHIITSLYRDSPFKTPVRYYYKADMTYVEYGFSVKQHKNLE